jgi:uncharacterized protein (DUF1684 family)
MKKYCLLLLLVAGNFLPVLAQFDSLKIAKDVLLFQEELNHEYKDPEKSPLPQEEIAAFKGHEFFPVAARLVVKARLVKTRKPETFKMKTSTDRLPEYVKYGEAHFTLAGKPQVLEIYQSVALREKPEYKDHLFLPFTDATNGAETYGGGRYLDLKIPKGKTIIIDFNKAYNPYCAYSKKYSCPVPPLANRLDLPIEAGVKDPHP